MAAVLARLQGHRRAVDHRAARAVPQGGRRVPRRQEQAREQALKGTPLEGNAELARHLEGPTGIAWSFEDPSAAAKVVKAFRKENEEHEKLTVKCGVLESTVLTGKRVESELATMPEQGRDPRAQLLATLMAPVQSLVRMLQAPAQNLSLRACDAKTRKESSEGFRRQLPALRRGMSG